MTKILSYDNFLFENALSSIEKDFEKKVKDLGFGNLTDMTEEESIEFLQAVLAHNGDVKGVKKSDLHESELNESEVVHALGEMGEILGSAAAIQFILEKIGKRFGAKNLGQVEQVLFKIVNWITDLTGVGQSLIKKTFELAAKYLGANHVIQKQIGRVGLALALVILLACAIAVFPAIGQSTSGFAVIIAFVASAAKVVEIGKLIKEVFDTLKNPSKADHGEYGDFFDYIGKIAKKHKEKLLPDAALAYDGE